MLRKVQDSKQTGYVVVAFTRIVQPLAIVLSTGFSEAPGMC